jgi:AcrR family transcriptional regulator
MSRWEPNARERLAAAALELYGERGFEQTTVAEIAERTGLTERTFFRHFADKREVLFGGQDALRHVYVEAIAAAPADASPIEFVEVALNAAALAAFPEDRRKWVQMRQRVIAANEGLMERELLKRASLVAIVTEALRDRGVPEPTASITAETGMAIFHVSFGLWIDEANDRPLTDIVGDSLARLKAVTSVI